jgi:hypothetical protein
MIAKKVCSYHRQRATLTCCPPSVAMLNCNAATVLHSNAFPNRHRVAFPLRSPDTERTLTPKTKESRVKLLRSIPYHFKKESLIKCLSIPNRNRPSRT